MVNASNDNNPAGQASLFEAATSDARVKATAARLSTRAPRLLYADRQQIELRACDLDALVAAEHPARGVWAFVHALDLFGMTFLLGLLLLLCGTGLGLRVGEFQCQTYSVGYFSLQGFLGGGELGLQGLGFFGVALALRGVFGMSVL